LQHQYEISVCLNISSGDLLIFHFICTGTVYRALYLKIAILSMKTTPALAARTDLQI
jgi:hypothetical protein